jgi:hypothetical protein
MPTQNQRQSKASWNTDFICGGRTYFSAASSHNRPDASNAVRDDELRTHWYDGALAAQLAEVPDFYCLCMSSEYDHRLFVDFSSDSCVAIKNPAELSARLRAAIARHHDELRAPRISAMYECPVIYIDPFLLAPPGTAAEVYFCKHFRFAYQTEFRFVLKAADNHRLQPFFLDVGSL